MSEVLLYDGRAATNSASEPQPQGGHAFAGNALVLPQGHLLGNIRPGDEGGDADLMSRRVEAVCKLYGLNGAAPWRGVETELELSAAREAAAAVVDGESHDNSAFASAADVQRQGEQLEAVFCDIFRGEVMVRDGVEKRETPEEVRDRAVEIIRTGVL